MYKYVNLFLCIILIAHAVVPSYSLPAGYICRSRRTDGKCLMMVNVLRDPHQMTTWNQRSFNKAINQLQAYQQLFNEDDAMMLRRRKRSISQTISS